MKPALSIRCALLLSASFSGAALAQESATDETADSTIIVVATGRSAATSASKAETPIIEAAQSISIISREEMDVRAVGTVSDALAYAHEREQFDRPIFDFQVIRHMLADMQTQVDAARLLVYRGAELASRHEPCAKEVAMGKLFASETLQNVSRMGMQILGGHSMLPDSDMERYFREGMQSTIGGGTSQIQRTIIAKAMHQNPG